MHIKIESQDTPSLNWVKNFGIWLDFLLKFDKNTSELVQKAFAVLKSIFINQHSFCPFNPSLLRETLVLSNFTYAEALDYVPLKKKHPVRF